MIGFLFFVATVLGANLDGSVITGGVTTSTAKVSVRTDGSGDVEIEYDTASDFSSSTTTSSVTTVSADDYTTTVELSGLSPDTIYYYQIHVDDVLQSTGYSNQFLTAPSGSQTFSFVVFSDLAKAANKASPGYESASNDDPSFMMQLGDFPHMTGASTLAESRAGHKKMRDTGLNHGAALAEFITSQMGFVHTWSDHDYCGDDEDRFCSNRANAWKAFYEYYPNHDGPNEANGIWHGFVWGDAEFFILDDRSQRDQNSDTDNSDKSMLDGASISDDQLSWLLDGLNVSLSKWKIIVSDVTTNKDARANSDDPWHSFSYEAEVIADFISDNFIEDVVVIAADLHCGGLIDGGTNGWFGIPEINVPHTNLAGGNDNRCGTWDEYSLGGRNNPGYALVTVTSTSLTLAVKAEDGTSRHSLVL